MARTILSPSGILLAGAGVSAGILGGIGIPAAAVVGGLLWAGRVGYAVMKGRSRAERIEPFTIQDPWRTLVHRAQSTGQRFEDAVRQTAPGPLHDRLAELGQRVQAAVSQAWAIAKRGNALDKAVRALDVQGVRRQLAAAERDAGQDASQDAIVRSLQAQLNSAQRLAGVAEDARERLQRLNAELAEAVARAVELSVSAADAAALQPLGSDVENVVGELESLRQALEETGGSTGASGSGGGGWRR